jgi:ABC transporter substrate binding protein (PQQ-dependent alcohol dehydrogenase system)
VALPVAADQRVRVLYLHQERAPVAPVSPLDKPAADEGLAGARLAIADTATTSRFGGPSLAMVERPVDQKADQAALASLLSSEDAGFVLSDLDEDRLAPLLTHSNGQGPVFINVRLQSSGLRAACHSNLLHTIPDYAMLADALAQYLVVQRWRRWFLVTGRHPEDKRYAAAVRRAAKRFGAEIAVEKEWTFQAGNARTDTGHVTLQSEVRAFTQVADYDVLVVADAANEFGEYLYGRTARPRPVAGTHGLVATGFDPVNEQWGAAQLHNRFERAAGRRMGAIDYAAWAAVRAIGEAAIRTRSADPQKITTFLRGSDFLLSGFKGQGQSFRSWDGQMRQPVLIVGPRMIVSASPQEGFLYRGSELDSLGIGPEESPCAR